MLNHFDWDLEPWVEKYESHASSWTLLRGPLYGSLGQAREVLTACDRPEPAHRHPIQAQSVAGRRKGAAGRLCSCQQVWEPLRKKAAGNIMAALGEYSRTRSGTHFTIRCPAETSPVVLTIRHVTRQVEGKALRVPLMCYNLRDEPYMYSCEGLSHDFKN